MLSANKLSANHRFVSLKVIKLNRLVYELEQSIETKFVVV